MRDSTKVLRRSGAGLRRSAATASSRTPPPATTSLRYPPGTPPPSAPIRIRRPSKRTEERRRRHGLRFAQDRETCSRYTMPRGTLQLPCASHTLDAPDNRDGPVGLPHGSNLLET